MTFGYFLKLAFFKQAPFAGPNSKSEQSEIIVIMRAKSALLLKVRILANDDSLRPARVSEKWQV